MTIESVSVHCTSCNRIITPNYKNEEYCLAHCQDCGVVFSYSKDSGLAPRDWSLSDDLRLPEGLFYESHPNGFLLTSKLHSLSNWALAALGLITGTAFFLEFIMPIMDSPNYAKWDLILTPWLIIPGFISFLLFSQSLLIIFGRFKLTVEEDVMTYGLGIGPLSSRTEISWNEFETAHAMADPQFNLLNHDASLAAMPYRNKIELTGRSRKEIGRLLPQSHIESIVRLLNDFKAKNP